MRLPSSAADRLTSVRHFFVSLVASNRNSSSACWPLAEVVALAAFVAWAGFVAWVAETDSKFLSYLESDHRQSNEVQRIVDSDRAH